MKNDDFPIDDGYSIDEEDDEDAVDPFLANHVEDPGKEPAEDAGKGPDRTSGRIPEDPAGKEGAEDTGKAPEDPGEEQDEENHALEPEEEAEYIPPLAESERQAQAAGRVVPSSRSSERGLIASMLKDPNQIAMAAGILKPEDFYFGVYRTVFQTLVAMNEAGRQIDMITLSEELKHSSRGAAQVSLADLLDIDQSEATSAFARDYAQIIREKSVLRSIIRGNDEITKACYAQEQPAAAILEQAESRVFALSREMNGESREQSIAQIVLEQVHNIEETAKSDNPVTGVPSGFTDLDRYLSGFQPSDFILVAARPSMGKTAFVLNVADYVARRQSITTAVFSLEMSRTQLANRLLSLESGVEADKLRKGNLDARDWNDLVEGANSLAKSKLIIDDTPGITVGQLRSKCRKYKMEDDLGLVIIDYLQLMTGSGRSDSRQQEISEISRSLKALARDLNVPVITLSQLSRAVEQRPDHRPILSDLRESGAIEQDADVVMFIYRDDYYNKESEEKNIAELIVAKQRNGPIGTVKLAWIPEQTKFANLARQPGNFHA
ncbi:MAG: replicative DNA helicase [Lachnospira sp.]|nr:replicative DNA helicase [Lachnospira sp.]